MALYFFFSFDAIQISRIRNMLHTFRTYLQLISTIRNEAKMVYNYERPTNDVFDFFIYSFLSSVVYLILTGRSEFKASLKFQYLVTFCVTSAAYLFPAMILFRLAIIVTPDSMKAPRYFLLSEFVMCMLFYLCTVIALILKHFAKQTRHLGLMDLHEHIDTLRDHPWLWRKTMAYFFCRFVMIYFLYIPLAIIANIIFIVLFNRPQVAFNDVLFFLAFSLIILSASIWLWIHVGSFQSVAHCELVVHCFILCYFMADNIFLAKMLLSSLSTYLVSFYSIILKPKNKDFYDMPKWFLFQMGHWTHYRNMSSEEFRDMELPVGTGKILREYHTLLYPREPAQIPLPPSPIEDIPAQKQWIGR